MGYYSNVNAALPYLELKFILWGVKLFWHCNQRQHLMYWKWPIILNLNFILPTNMQVAILPSFEQNLIVTTLDNLWVFYWKWLFSLVKKIHESSLNIEIIDLFLCSKSLENLYLSLTLWSNDSDCKANVVMDSWKLCQTYWNQITDQIQFIGKLLCIKFIWSCDRWWL